MSFVSRRSRSSYVRILEDEVEEKEGVDGVEDVQDEADHGGALVESFTVRG